MLFLLLATLSLDSRDGVRTRHSRPPLFSFHSQKMVNAGAATFLTIHVPSDGGAFSTTGTAQHEEMDDLGLYCLSSIRRKDIVFRVPSVAERWAMTDDRPYMCCVLPVDVAARPWFAATCLAALSI